MTHDDLLRWFHYDPETGDWTRLAKQGRGIRRSKQVGTLCNGYHTITIDRKQYKAHVLAWFYMTGEWPSRQVDHRDNSPLNNIWSNLRLATNAENGQNRHRPSRNNKSGYLGVSRSSRHRWRATISDGEKQVVLGHFDTPEEASDAYLAGKKELHPFYEPKVEPK